MNEWNNTLVAQESLVEKPREITLHTALSSDLLNVDWGEIYSGNLGRWFWFNNFPERFENYRQTGVVDWGAEEWHISVRERLQTGGEPDVDKICEYLRRDPGQAYAEDVFLALPKPRDLSPEDFSKIQDALLDHMAWALSLWKLSTFLEFVHNIWRDYFDDFRLIFDLLPIAIRPDIIKALPSYWSFSNNGNLTDNIDDIRAAAESIFPEQSEEIVASIWENRGLYVSMQCLSHEMWRYRRIPVKPTLLGVPALQDTVAERTKLLTEWSWA